MNADQAVAAMVIPSSEEGRPPSVDLVNLRALIEAGMAMRPFVRGVFLDGQNPGEAWDRALKEATE